MKVPALILLVITLLPACTPAAPNGNILETNAAIIQKVQDTATAQAFLMNRSTAANAVTATYTATHASVPTQTPSPTTTPAPQPTATFEYPVLTVATELPALDASGLADRHGLILFRSEGNSLPFNFIEIERIIGIQGDNGYFGAVSRYCRYLEGYGCLWALSPDGQAGGMVSARDFDFNWYLPPDGPPQFVENGFIINHPAIQPVRLPEICSQDPASSSDQRCDQIRFSPDGRFLAFRYAQDNCGRAMQVVDRKTGEIILSMKGGVHGFRFLSNGKLMIRSGHCEGSGASFFDPATRQTVGGGGLLGSSGARNQSGTILVMSGGSYDGNSNELWGYNLNTGTVFRPEKGTAWPFDEHPIFLPDERRFLYQHLRIGVEGSGNFQYPVIDTPAQIVRYDPTTGQRAVLVSDPSYHYRLCQFDYEQPCPMQWYGDWIQVQRVPFAEVRPSGGEWNIHTELPCFAEGKECGSPPESFALNAHTGELRPWDPAALPLAYPTPTPTPGPDILGKPIYTDPAGKYALYVGADGKSLWMQPKVGPAVKWVGNSEGFLYLP